MRIGVLSDTHAYSLEDLPKRLLDELSGVDLIIHAGDYTGKMLLDQLRKLGNFKGVYGNMDPHDVRSELLESETVEVKGFSIGVTHPSEGGSPFRLEKKVKAKFRDVDMVIYGHSHRAKNEVVDNVLCFNPGSATGAFPAMHKTYGILKVMEKIEGEIIKL